MKLIFAQGNPEPEHAGSRHNIGFAILNVLAEENDLKWKELSKFHAKIAEESFRNEKVILVKPSTFYNETGPAVRKLIDFYKLQPKSDLLVIHDDLALPFGTVRIRKSGSDAGNNGIKSINTHIGSDYHRIKIGIRNEKSTVMDDADFVLAKFSRQESKQLDNTLIPHVIKLINEFIEEGSLDHTSHTMR
jgi:PTH1 family peptidyl-tRNA hydrolase